MNGTIQYSFTPAQLVAEMLCNINPSETLTERQAYRAYGEAKIDKMVSDALITFERLTDKDDSNKIFRRIDIEKVILEQKYINKLKILKI